MAKAKPFVKWVGGKTQLIEQLEALLPADFDKRDNVTYIEPFVGGGAMLFHMLQTHPNIKSAIINDINSDLITCYRVVRDKPTELVISLSDIQNEYYSLSTEEAKKDMFLNARDRYNTKELNDIENTTLFFFLNRTCFNGLYRVNKSGKFNVPFGKNPNPTICDSSTIYADSELLQNVEILNGDFEHTFDYIADNTLFYFDPPYRPLSNTSSFNDYTKDSFNDDAQRRLKLFCDKVHQKGCSFMLSNSDCLGKDGKDRFFDDLYMDYNIDRVWASRNINAVASKRGKLTEILVNNHNKSVANDGVLDNDEKPLEQRHSSDVEKIKCKKMGGGLFIALYDEESLKLYLDKGVYGFLMSPVMSDKPASHSRHYQILADYACSREGTDVFFFLKRKIVYGGKIYGNKDAGSFYLNGKTSPLGRAADAELFWDESVRPKYFETDTPGVFRIKNNGGVKSQPFMFQFRQNEHSGKYILSDDLYFELGKYPYPLPSNSMQGMGFCTLTPGEVKTLNSLISQSEKRIVFEGEGTVDKKGYETLFDSKLVSIEDDLVNEAQLEFTILSSIEPFAEFLQDEYVLCRQVPISPFKPSEMDRADICLYSLSQPIKNGTIPNVIIELKKDAGNKAAYDQVVRYLKWIRNISTAEEYSKVKAYIIAPRIVSIKASSVPSEYVDKIFMYSISEKCFVPLKK